MSTDSIEVVAPGDRPSAVRPWPIAVTPAPVGAGLAVAVTIALRLALLFRYRIDSDETQHLHVVWGWSHGLMQYRDLFDNHMPLFHLLSLPLLWLSGERPDALILGRVAMLPLVALIALLTYRIGVSVGSRRAALLATLLALFAPDFFLSSIEYRPDVPWAACWMATLAILVRKPLTPRRAAAAGLMLGLAAAISAKTSLLAVCLLLAAVGALIATRESRVGGREVGTIAACLTLAALLPPALIAIAFAAAGAWKPFLHGTVTHNLVASDHPRRLLLLPLLLVIILFVVRRIATGDGDATLRRRRIFLFLAASLYATLLLGVWPIIESEHWLPFYPAAAAAVGPFFMSRGNRRRRTGVALVAVAVLALELLWIVKAARPWRNQSAASIALIEEGMRLTSPGDRVVDLKGELLFRRRAFNPVLEKITKNAIARGRLADTLAADVIRTGTMVAVADSSSFPRNGRAFLLRNFISVGCLRVAGMLVPDSRTVRIELPARYSVVSAHGPFRGTVDGTPYTAPRLLAAGTHLISPSTPAIPSIPTALLWTRAATLGYSPFVRDARCTMPLLPPPGPPTKNPGAFAPGFL